MLARLLQRVTPAPLHHGNLSATPQQVAEQRHGERLARDKNTQLNRSKQRNDKRVCAGRVICRDQLPPGGQGRHPMDPHFKKQLRIRLNDRARQPIQKFIPHTASRYQNLPIVTPPQAQRDSHFDILAPTQSNSRENHANPSPHF
jgi:hypothetical protein